MPPPSGSIASGWTTPSSSRSRAAPTAACSSARRSPSAPTSTAPWCARRRCSTWCATRLRLGATWNVEYGTADVPEQFGWLLAYSPYHHVREGVDYPATLFTVFDGDTRVDPMHARKMCAALQHATSGTRPVLLRAEGDVGHGARALSRSVDHSADMLAFAARWTGLVLDPGAGN